MELKLMLICFLIPSAKADGNRYAFITTATGFAN